MAPNTWRECERYENSKKKGKNILFFHNHVSNQFIDFIYLNNYKKLRISKFKHFQNVLISLASMQKQGMHQSVKESRQC